MVCSTFERCSSLETDGIGLTLLFEHMDDDRFARSGAKNGGQLEIREPNQFTIRTGRVMDTQDVEESTVQLVVATQKGVDVNFSSVELTLSLDDFSERILNPAMARLAAEVDATVITNAYQNSYNYVPGTLANPVALADVLSARAKLSKGLAPASDRYVLTESLSTNAIITGSQSLFNPSGEIAKQYDQGVIGMYGGFKFYETEMIPNHTTGSRTDTTPVANTSTGITSGTATITTTGYTSGHTVKQGDIITVAGVYAINPETKARYNHLQQFAITADKTLTGTDVLAVTPTPISSGAKQNIEIVSAGASKAVENLDHGLASTVYPQNLAYHKDSMTFVTADLEMPNGVDFASRQVYDGISLRVVRDFDIINDKFPCRLDVLFGQKLIRPEWMTRMSG